MSTNFDTSFSADVPVLNKTINYREQTIRIYKQSRPTYTGTPSFLWHYQVNDDKPVAAGRRSFAIAAAGRSIDDDLDGIVGKVRFDYVSGRKTSWDEDYRRVLGE